MTKGNHNEIQALNETVLSELSIDELETRLQLEQIEPRGELWTSCSCATECANYTSCPYRDQDCPRDEASEPGCGLVYSW